MAEILEFRWHGRGGQGAVTAAKVFAEAALAEGSSFRHSLSMVQSGLVHRLRPTIVSATRRSTSTAR